jgi:hypothetical protein
MGGAGMILQLEPPPWVKDLRPKLDFRRRKNEPSALIKPRNSNFQLETKRFLF